MNRARRYGWLGILIGCLVVGGVICERGWGADPKGRPVVAIFVKNRIGLAGESQVAVLEDLLAARLSGLGYRIISSGDVLQAVARFAGQESIGEGAKVSDPESIVADSASALRLAQDLGADCLLMVSMASFNTEQRRTEAYGTERIFLRARLSLAYKFLDTAQGASVDGGTVEMESRKLISQDQPDSAPVPAILWELVSQGAEALVAKLQLNPPNLVGTDPPKLVSWAVACGTSGLTVPAIYQDQQGQWVVGQEKLAVVPVNVTVELNGVVIGTAPGTFQVRSGLHRLRLSRPGYEDFQGTVNVVDGQTLRIDLRMTEEEYARWKEMTELLESLKAGAGLTGAQAEAIRGYARMLSQSGFKVDVQKKIDVEQKTKAEGKPDQIHIWTASW